MSAAKSQRILVVDDEPLVRQYIREILEDNGHAVVEASCVEEALLLMAGENMAIVVADIEMPGGDGLWLLRTIKSKWPAAKLIVMSGRMLPRRSDLPIGTDVLTKPFSMDRLLYVVEGD